MAVAPTRDELARATGYLRAYTDEAEARAIVARHFEGLAKRAPHDIAAHAELLHTTEMGDPIVFPQHMQVWAHLAMAIEKYRWLVLVAPTSYAKTTFWSQIYPAWEIGRNPRTRTGLISNTAGQAYENSKAVQDVVTKPMFQAVYGAKTQPSYADRDGWGWAQERWYVQGSAGPPHATMRAFGMDGPILGRRLDKIIMDDPTTWDQARSRAQMEAQRRKLMTTIITRLPAGQRPPDNRPDMHARMVVVCTRWGERDLVHDLEDIGFKVVTMPALGYWDAVRDQFTGEWVYGTAPLWPVVESQQQLLELRDRWGSYFDLVWQGNAKAGRIGTTFDPDNFQRGRCPYGDMTQVTAWVDTAAGKSREKGDYFVMSTLGQNARRDLPGTENWVINVNRERYNVLEQHSQVEREAEYLHRLGCSPQAIYIATSNEGGAGLYQRLVANTRLPLVEASEREDKETRAVPLAAAYKLRYVWHDNAKWNQPFEAELEGFPEGDHDDQVDSAAGAYNKMGNVGPQVLSFRSKRQRR